MAFRSLIVFVVLFVGGCYRAQVLQKPEADAEPRVMLGVASARYSYRVDLVDARWQPVRAESLSPGADMALQYGGGAALMVVFAEQVGAVRLDDYLKKSRGYSRLVAGIGADFTTAQAAMVRGEGGRYPAWLIEREVHRAYALRYYSLVTVADGVGYSALCWGSAFTPQLEDMCRSALAGLRPLSQHVVRSAPGDARKGPGSI